MRTQIVKLSPRKNPAAWRFIRCPVCKMGKQTMCVTLAGPNRGKPRVAHRTRIHLAESMKKRRDHVHKNRRLGRPRKHGRRIVYA